MRKTQKKVLLFLMVVTSIILLHSTPFNGNIMVKEISAAEKPSKIKTYKKTMGIEDTILAYDYIDTNGYNYTYKSSNTSVLTIDTTGYGRTHALGTATFSIYASVKGTNVKVADIKVTVVPPKLSTKECRLVVGGTENVLMYDNYSIQKFTFTSSDPNVVTTTAYVKLLGVNPGTANVTVSVTYKGETKKLGTIKVEVAKAYIAEKNMKVPLSSEDDIMVSSFEIIDQNKDAIYTYTSADPKIVKVNKTEGFFLGVKYGKTKITVTETYNGKSRKLGSVTVEVPRASITSSDDGYDIFMRNSYELTEIININFPIHEATYTWTSADSSILMKDENDYMLPIKEGQTTVTVYEEYKGLKRSIGTTLVIIKEPVLRGIEFNEDAFDELTTLYLHTDYEIDLETYIYLYPYNAPSKVTYSSSNENVIKIVDDNIIEIVGLGTVTITATCVNFTDELDITVTE